MNNLFLILALLSFPVMLYFGIRILTSYLKKNKPHMIKMSKFLGVTFGVMVVSFIAFFVTIDPATAEQAKINVAEREEAKKVAVLAQKKADAKTAEEEKAKMEKKTAEAKKLAEEQKVESDKKAAKEKVAVETKKLEEASKLVEEKSKPNSAKTTSSTTPKSTSENTKTEVKPVVKQGESLQSYIDGTLEPLVRSVSTNIDLNWGFYMIEPFERLEAGGSMNPFHSDIGLLDSLYTGIIKQIDESKTPDHFAEKEIKEINEIKSELKNAINKRIEVIDILTEITNRKEALNTDILEIIEKSNENLQKAATTYMSLGK